MHSDDKSKSAENTRAEPQRTQDGLIRRGDNVGQSGRWRREGDAGADRYGHEERFHSTEHPAAPADEPPHREPNADKPNATTYEGRYAAPQDTGSEDNKARYDNSAYAEAGGEIGEDKAVRPGEDKWQGEAGAGVRKDYPLGADRATDEERSKG
jgi:hypothetical protein